MCHNILVIIATMEEWIYEVESIFPVTFLNVIINIHLWVLIHNVRICQLWVKQQYVWLELLGEIVEPFAMVCIVLIKKGYFELYWTRTIVVTMQYK